MKIATNILAAISAATFTGPRMTLADQLDRKVYVDVAKVIELAGGKWNKKAKAHLFGGDAWEAMESVILTGEVVDRGFEFGEFFTPPEIAEQVVQAAEIEPGMLVLEPSAGRGALALAATLAGAAVETVELQERHCEFLQAGGFRPLQTDFLTVTPNPIYHRVVMNPPFRGRADVRHVEHALKFLRPEGKLVAIMSAGVIFREDHLTVDFREGWEPSIERLPEGSFKASGTEISTVMVTVRKGPAHGLSHD